MFEIFADHADEDGLLTLDVVERCFLRLVQGAGGSTPRSLDTSRTRAIINRVLLPFVQADEAGIDFTMLMCGFSVLCGGGFEDKIEAAFSLFDLNNEGAITLEDLERYLCAVYTVLFQTSLASSVGGMSPADFAKTVAEQCYEDVGLPPAGLISSQQFSAWQSHSGGDAGMGAPDEDQAQDDDEDGDRVIVEYDLEMPQALDIQAGEQFLAAGGVPPMCSASEARALTRLDVFSVNDVFEIFAEATDEDSRISRNAFLRSFGFLVRVGGGTDDEARTAAAVLRLFDLFDDESERFVDYKELVCGLSVLAGGSMDSKVLAAFRLLDAEQTGTMTLGDFTAYIRSVFRVMFETQPDLAERMGPISADDLAEVTAQQCFADADTTEDGNLTFEQFKEWCLNMDV